MLVCPFIRKGEGRRGVDQWRKKDPGRFGRQKVR